MERGLVPYVRQRSAVSWSVTYRGKERAFRGRTKTAALENARDWMAEVERDHHGLELRLKPHTIAQAFALYAETAKHLASWDSIRARWDKWLIPKFGGTLLTKLKPHEVDVYFAGLLQANGGPLSPGTVNHLRNHLRRLYTWASTKGRIFRGENPMSQTDAPDMPEPEPKAIGEADLRAIIRAAPDKETQVLLAVAFVSPFRKGELLGLKKASVDLARARIWVAKSYGTKTKNKKPRPLPIHPELVPLLEEWMKRNPSEYMFPGPDGKPRTKHFDAAEMFRKCMLRAGLIRGWQLECRKRNAGPTGRRNGRSKLTEAQVVEVKARAGAGDRHTDIGKDFGISRRMVGFIANGTNWSSRPSAPRGGCGWKAVEEKQPVPGRTCPTCGAVLRVRPLALDFQFRHTRSTAITRVVENTGDLRVAQQLAGHASFATTERNYAARRVEHLRAAVDRLPSVLNAFSNDAVTLPKLARGNGMQPDVTDDDSPRIRLEHSPLEPTGGL